jgi:hypothetical protein
VAIFIFPKMEPSALSLPHRQIRGQISGVTLRRGACEQRDAWIFSGVTVWPQLSEPGSPERFRACNSARLGDRRLDNQDEAAMRFGPSGSKQVTASPQRSFQALRLVQVFAGCGSILDLP